ncbi:sensor histidine kinase [Actibacterium ureilyticum]|uniref:sensor histidine kinase n=1 Tax=Actibacterium ureilyticum TaxID=1590614 RepID=UPI000BAB18D4|nr:sensor histidine kinase [Actibacterium ureilyticum]
MRQERQKRNVIALNRSPLARKIVTFNLVALLVLVAGILYLNPGRDSLVEQHENAFVTQTELIANVISAQLPMLQAAVAVDDAVPADGTVPTSEPAPAPVLLPPAELSSVLAQIKLPTTVEAYIYDPAGTVVASSEGSENRVPPIVQSGEDSTMITDFLNGVWETLAAIVTPNSDRGNVLPPVARVEQLAPLTFEDGQTKAEISVGTGGATIFAVTTPIMQKGAVLGVLAMTSAGGEIDLLVRSEREQVLQMFVIAILVSIGLSLVLASTIANPLSDLAAAAEIGRDKNARKMSPSRVRIPDLTARPDEIGRLSGALRGMVTALYDRIDANEQFAADVAHEIKNPLASLRSAVGSLRMVKKDEHRAKLLDVIEHDVRRLDRLVSDISNASRLDSELVKEEEESFNLRQLLENLSEHLGEDAREKGVDFISDLPSEPVVIQGLEPRLAQVFVNLITNAISFCEEGDAVRIWARKRQNRVLIVVEDTGPGIPEQALTKIFNRFYSERPERQFGDHSGLGLAISKQIVEAHGGVIWAENIRPTDADITSEPLGARFVVGLPI